MMTKEQTEILRTVMESIPRVAALAQKAEGCGCGVLAGDLYSIAKQLKLAADIQIRALSDDGAIREAALCEAAAPFRIA